MTNFILGLDVGTTSVKAVLLATDSRTVSVSHALPTAADISEDGGIKVSNFAISSFFPWLSGRRRRVPSSS